MAALESWLLTTIPGVILLGAIGSLVAAGAVKVTSAAITSWFPMTKRWWLFRKNLELAPHGWLLGSLAAEENVSVLLAYFTFRVMKFIGMLFFSGLCFITYVVLASATEGKEPTPESVVFLLFGFASFYFAGREVRIVRIVYDREVIPRIKKFRESLKAGVTGADNGLDG